MDVICADYAFSSLVRLCFVLFARTSTCNNNITNCPNKGYRTSTYIAFNEISPIFVQQQQYTICTTCFIACFIDGAHGGKKVVAKEKGNYSIHPNSNWMRSPRAEDNEACCRPVAMVCQGILEPSSPESLNTCIPPRIDGNGQMEPGTRRNDCAAPTCFSVKAVDCQWYVKRMRSSPKK